MREGKDFALKGEKVKKTSTLSPLSAPLALYAALATTDFVVNSSTAA